MMRVGQRCFKGGLDVPHLKGVAHLVQDVFVFVRQAQPKLGIASFSRSNLTKGRIRFVI